MPVYTDWLVFGTGSGANVEDIPAYTADPLRQSGNLPGIARSNFNNRAIRQGTFVATAVSTFITQTLLIPVYDDGDLQKYVDYFRQALQALFTGLLPDDPDLSLYVRKAGDTMVGDLQFGPGASIQLYNNTWLRAKNTSGVPLNAMMRGADNNLYISDGASAYTIIGNTPLVGNSRFWSCQITTGGVVNVLGILSDNNTYMYAYNNLFINSATTWFNSAIVIPNGSWYHSKLTNGAPINILCVDTANQTNLYSPNDLILSCPGNRWIYLYAPQVVCSGTLQTPYIRSVGSGQVDGNFVVLGALQVNGGSNFYSHLNVNYGAGADISGTLNTNTLHCINAHAYFDGNTYCWDGYHGGSIFVGGLQAFNSSGWFWFNNHLQAHYLHSRTDIACPGTISGGAVNSGGNMNAAGTYTGGNVSVNGQVYAGWRLAAGGDLWVAGLTFGNSDGYWHTGNGIAVDSRLWARGEIVAHNYTNMFYVDTITWGGRYSYWENNGCVMPLYYGQGAVGSGERPWAWMVCTGGFAQVSDEREKTDIEPVPSGCLDLVRNIVPQTFRMTHEEPTLLTSDAAPPGPSWDGEPATEMVSPANLPLALEMQSIKAATAAELELVRNRRQWGFVAQDVGRAMEEAGFEFGGRMIGGRDNRQSLAMMDMIAVLWAAVRELSDEVKTLKAS